MASLQYSIPVLYRARNLLPLARTTGFTSSSRVEKNAVLRLVVSAGLSTKSSLLAFRKAGWIFVPLEIVKQGLVFIIIRHTSLTDTELTQRFTRLCVRRRRIRGGGHRALRGTLRTRAQCPPGHPALGQNVRGGILHGGTSCPPTPGFPQVMWIEIQLLERSGASAPTLLVEKGKQMTSMMRKALLIAIPISRNRKLESERCLKLVSQIRSKSRGRERHLRAASLLGKRFISLFDTYVGGTL